MANMYIKEDYTNKALVECKENTYAEILKNLLQEHGSEV